MYLFVAVAVVVEFLVLFQFPNPQGINKCCSECFVFEKTIKIYRPLCCEVMLGEFAGMF